MCRLGVSVVCGCHSYMVWCLVIWGGEVVMRACEVDVEVDVGVGGVVWCHRRAFALTLGRIVSVQCCCGSTVAVNSFPAFARVNSPLSCTVESVSPVRCCCVHARLSARASARVGPPLRPPPSTTTVSPQSACSIPLAPRVSRPALALCVVSTFAFRNNSAALCPLHCLRCPCSHLLVPPSPLVPPQLVLVRA